jgi:NACalpha-BTF3-like transcription factor
MDTHQQTTKTAAAVQALQEKMLAANKIAGARKVAGSRRMAVRGTKKVKSAFSLLNDLLQDKEYQLSKALPDTGNIELLSKTEKHMKILDPIIRVSSRAKLLFVTGQLVELSDEEKNNLSLPMVVSQAKPDDKEKGNRHQRRLRPVVAKCLRDHQMNSMPDIEICRVNIQKIPYVVEYAEVVRIDKSNTFLIWGELIMGATSAGGSKRTELTGNNLGNQELTDNDDDEDGIPKLTDIVDPFKGNNAIESGNDIDEKEVDDDEQDIKIPDDASFTRNDVQIVMENTGCSRAEAVQELVANKGDLINTIMKLTPS